MSNEKWRVGRIKKLATEGDRDSHDNTFSNGPGLLIEYSQHVYASTLPFFVTFLPSSRFSMFRQLHLLLCLHLLFDFSSFFFFFDQTNTS